MSERKVPTPFLTKTYQLVDDPSTDNVVSWNESGTAFVVWKTADFAKDLLPNYFKHCNFSSFIRQLNTYGFRKMVADKWEFANDNFRRGEQELLAKMRRRKTVTTATDPTSLVNSGDDHGSSSTSNPDSKNPGSLETPSTAQIANLSDENEKLRIENKTLRSELTQIKKQCDEVIAFLTKYVNVGPDQINSILNNGVSGSNCNGVLTLNWNGDDDDEKFGNNGEDDGKCLKLFGVWLKKKEKKRGLDENINDIEGPLNKHIKIVDRMQISSGEEIKL